MQVFFGVAIFVVFVGGWFVNLYKIAMGDFDPLTGMMVLRIIGAFIAPLGGILGWV